MKIKPHPFMHLNVIETFTCQGVDFNFNYQILPKDSEQFIIVEEPNLKKCVIKGDNCGIKGPTKNLYTVEPRLTNTLVRRTPLLNEQF